MQKNKYSNDTKWNSTLDNISTALGAASLIPGLDTFADIAAIPVDIARVEVL